MKSKDAIGRIAKIIQKFTGTELVVCEQIAERIYADVVSVCVNDEMDRWLMVAYAEFDPDKLDS